MDLLNKLQLYKGTWHSGLVDENMLSQALLTKPEVVTPILSYVFGKFENNTMDFLTRGMGRVQFIENREYEWPLMGEDEKAIPIIKALDQFGAVVLSDSVVGGNGQLFTIVLPEKWFGAGAIISFDDREYSARVQGEAIQDGENFVYTLHSTSSKGIPGSLLQPGNEVSRDFSAYEEYSDEADDVNFATPFKMRNQLTTIRLKYAITRSAYDSVMIITIQGDNGKSTNLWSTWQEWQALRQWYKMLDRQLIYSKYNATPEGVVELPGTSGRPVYIGAGLREQISPSNKRGYLELSAKILDDFLFDLSYNTLSQGQRKFVALTGEMGMREFDRVLKEKASSYQLIDTHFVTGTGQELTLGGQFTTYKMLNGVEMTLIHFPLYDNTIIHRKLHPISKRPIESYRYTFLDYGMYDGESNVIKMVRKDADMLMWHVAGSTAPGSGTAKSISTMRASSKDGYEVNFLSECGVMVKNPLSSGELICEAE